MRSIGPERLGLTRWCTAWTCRSTTASRRAHYRLSTLPADAHRIDDAGVRLFATIFEQPTDDEGLRIIGHVWASAIVSREAHGGVHRNHGHALLPRRPPGLDLRVITNEAGRVVERLSYDAGERRRHPDGGPDPAGAITSAIAASQRTGKECPKRAPCRTRCSITSSARAITSSGAASPMACRPWELLTASPALWQGNADLLAVFFCWECYYSVPCT